MGINATSFTVIIVGGGDRLIQAAQGQQQSIATQSCGAQQAGLMEQQKWAPPDGRGDDSDGIAIAENNVDQRLGDREDNQVGLQCNAMTNMMMTTKEAVDHDKEDPSKGGKYAWRAKARRRDQRLPRRYVTRPSMLTKARQCSCSWQRQRSRPPLHRRCCWEWGQQQSSRDCCCRNDILDDDDDDELAWELAGTR